MRPGSGSRGLQDTLALLKRDLLRDPQDEHCWHELARLGARTGSLPDFLDRDRHLPPLLEILSRRPEDPSLIRLALDLLGLEPEPDWSGRGFPDHVTRRRDRSAMILLTGGAFTSRRIGSEVLEDTPTVREVRPVYMDRWEVSVEAYACFLQATGAPAPRYWKRQLEAPRAPAVFLSWPDVVVYALWAGGRPPREAEWELACQHQPPARFPWGNDEATPEHANFHWEDGFRDPRNWDQYLTPSGATPKGSSQIGIEDLLGNVQEWCLRDEAPFPPAPEEPGGALRQESGTSRDAVLRGVSWRHKEAQLHVLARQEIESRTRESTIGFRLVVPVAP